MIEDDDDDDEDDDVSLADKLKVLSSCFYLFLFDFLGLWADVYFDRAGNGNLSLLLRPVRRGPRGLVFPPLVGLLSWHLMLKQKSMTKRVVAAPPFRYVLHSRGYLVTFLTRGFLI